MRLFVTGGTGFIGSHFLNVASDAGHEAVALRRSAESKPRIPLSREPQWLTKEMKEVSEADFTECDVLVHLAAHGVTEGTNDWKECFRVNVTESIRVWRRAADAGVKRFVICGSCFEYGKAGERYDFIPADAPLEPTGAYHASKAAATMAAIGLGYQYALELTVLRPFHVYGEGENDNRFWPCLREASKSNRDLPMTLGEQIRDFIPVEEVAKEFLNACTMEVEKGAPQVRNVGTGVPTTLRAFAERWWKKWKATGELKVGAIPYRPTEVMRYVPKI